MTRSVYHKMSHLNPWSITKYHVTILFMWSMPHLRYRKIIQIPITWLLYSCYLFKNQCIWFFLKMMMNSECYLWLINVYRRTFLSICMRVMQLCSFVRSMLHTPMKLEGCNKIWNTCHQKMMEYFMYTRSTSEYRHSQNYEQCCKQQQRLRSLVIIRYKKM